MYFNFFAYVNLINVINNSKGKYSYMQNYTLGSKIILGIFVVLLLYMLIQFALKLLEMGCLPGNIAKLIQIAPLGDPFYFNINDSHVAIRKETAIEVTVVLENQI